MPRLRTQEEKDAICEAIAQELYEKHSDIKIKIAGGKKKVWADEKDKPNMKTQEKADIEGWKAVASTVVDILEAHH